VIRFNCRCGKRIKVSADVAGKRVRCPFCGRTVQAPRGRKDATPGPGAPPVTSSTTDGAPEQGGATGLEALAQAVRANGNDKPADRGPLATARQKAKKQELPTSAQLIGRRVGANPSHKKAILIGVVAAVVLLALVIGLSALLSSSGEPEKLAEQTPPPTATGRPRPPGDLFKNVPFEP